MVIGVPMEIEYMMKVQNPMYQDGYVDGFEAARKSILQDLKQIEQKIKGMEPFSTGTSTATK